MREYDIIASRFFLKIQSINFHCSKYRRIAITTNSISSNRIDEDTRILRAAFAFVLKRVDFTRRLPNFPTGMLEMLSDGRAS